MKSGILLLAVLLVPLSGLAEAYKCKMPDGRIEFSDTPCTRGQTLTVRPDETISGERRANAEREVERMRDFVEQRESVREKDNESARTSAKPAEQTPPAALIEDCLNELERLSLTAGQRAQMEASCKKTGAAHPPGNELGSTVVGNSVARCIRNVELLNFSPQMREYRILQCQGLTPVRPPLPSTIPARKPEKPVEPAHPLCPPGNLHCGKTAPPGNR